MLALVLFGCQNANQEADSHSPLTIAVAANVQFAMNALESAFEAKHNFQIETVVSSSGKLTAQIRQGAPYHLFLAANMKYPEYLEKEGFAASPPEVYALGSLVAWTLNDLPLDSGMQVLTYPSVQKIALANPKNAPYGEAAIQVLRQMNLLKEVEHKLIYGESIAQTNQYLLSKASDIGFTAKSVVLSPELAGKGKWIALNPKYYQPIEQGVIITTTGQEKQPAACKAFLEFLKQKEAQTILERYGYQIP